MSILRHPFFLGLVAAVAFALAFLVFNSEVPFLYDDLGQILTNPALHEWWDLKSIINSPQRPGRLVQNLTFVLDWALTPHSPLAFHFTNNLLHAANTLLLGKLLITLGLKNKRVVYFTCLIFLLHPLQIEAFTYIMGRTELLKTFVTFIVLILYAGEKRSKALIYTLLVLSLLVKETCSLTLILFVTHDLILKRYKWKELPFTEYALYLSHLLWIPLFNSFIDLYGVHANLVGFNLYPTLDYIVGNFYYLTFYLYLFFNSADQSFFHAWVNNPPMIMVVFGIALYLGMLFMVFFRARKYPLAAFMITFFWVSFLPHQSILQFMNPFAEYRLYQSTAVIALFVAYLIFGFTSNLKVRFFAATMLGLYFIMGHYFYLRVWQHRLTVWEYGLQKYPQSRTLQLQVALAYMEENRCQEAMKPLILACKNPPAMMKYSCQLDLAILYLRVGNKLMAKVLLEEMLARPEYRRTSNHYSTLMEMWFHATGEKNVELWAEAKKKFPGEFPEAEFKSQQSLVPCR